LAATNGTSLDFAELQEIFYSIVDVSLDSVNDCAFIDVITDIVVHFKTTIVFGEGYAERLSDHIFEIITEVLNIVQNGVEFK